ncbi:hypothetical protein ACXP6L_10970, partial [Acinetobacter baumannii]
MKDKPTLTYQLPTQSCWTHTWIKPPFCHPELGHENDTRFSLYTTNFTEPLSYQGSAFLKLPKFP